MVSFAPAPSPATIVAIPVGVSVIWDCVDWNASSMAERGISTRVSRTKCLPRLMGERVGLCDRKFMGTCWYHESLQLD